MRKNGLKREKLPNLVVTEIANKDTVWSHKLLYGCKKGEGVACECMCV